MLVEEKEELVLKSVKGYSWINYPNNIRKVTSIQQKTDLPEVIAKILDRLNIEVNQIAYFLNPTLRDLLPDPFLLKDMEKAAIRIANAIINQEKIVIFGDYDVDGSTSSALLLRFFRMLDIEANFYIPDRIIEGYGPNLEAFKQLCSEGNNIIITVDCGTVSFEPIEYAANNNVDVIIVDHHKSTEELPKALAVINPNRYDEDSICKNMAAVAVCFLLTIAVNNTLRSYNFFADKKEPNLISLLDLVALGTICDVVPLDMINRALVKQGLKVLASRKNKGITAICDKASIDDYPNEYHLGYIIGPRINAAGRVGDSSLGTKILSTYSEDLAAQIAEILERNNSERKKIEQKVLEEAMQIAQQQDKQGLEVILVCNDKWNSNWHQGVIGIVAGRIKESFNKPTAVIAIDKDIGKASCRSIKGVDFGKLVLRAKAENLIISGGGHAMAAGFSVEAKKIKELHQFLIDEVIKQELDDSHFTKYFDGFLSVNAVNKELAMTIEKLGPFGSGIPEPRFAITDAQIEGFEIFEGGHIRFWVKNNITGKNIKAMMFRALENGVDKILSKKKFKAKALIVALKLSRWNGIEQAQIIIDDIIF